MKKNKKIYIRAYSAEEKLKALNLLKNCSFEFVAHRYHCTIQSLYRWKKLYNGSLDSLQPKYCAPYTPHPNRHSEEEIKHIRDLIKRNSHIGLNELYGKLRLHYGYTRHPSSLYRFLRKHGYYEAIKKQNKYVPQHYETPARLGMKWQLDVKYVPRSCYVGDFKDEKRFFQYTVIDEATRERFIYPYEEQCPQSTIDFVRRAIAFFHYKPKQIQTDNGAEFTYLLQTKHDKNIFLICFVKSIILSISL